jgi:HTH-type transcriptional regulator/antitoxin HigA
MAKHPFNPDYRIPPGVTLHETIAIRGMGRDELAEKLGVTTRFVDLLILGDAVLTPEIATKLQEVLLIPAGFWNRAEAAYRRPLKETGATP